MLAYWILLPVLLLLQRVAGMSVNEVSDPRSFAIESSLQHHLRPEDGYPDNDGIRRFECPAGFFRLRRYCYYLSGGTSNWRDAHFQCTARNATLAVLNRYGKDKILRKYLMGDQFKPLERWIGGIYNWQQNNWDWGVSGDKVLFRNFGDPEASKNRNWIHHCMILDPEQQYKWNARGCYEHKYFICEVPAGRIGRWRKNINSDPLAPQNQRLRPPRKGSNSRAEISQQQQLMRRRKKLKSMRKKNYDDNQVWAHGIKLGARPPKGSYRTSYKWQKLGAGKDRNSKSPRHGHKPRGMHRAEPRIEQATPGAAGKYEAFPGDGSLRIDENLQRLGPDFTREEVLLKV
ncbi:uncharacterized protein LOC100679909 isoform X2 [Nasonia vitripennis]|uniref:C-type lectin domain-containing protein n=1 Tax=Nasonia vitripennis TaxID=7425 RepID=A0A7M7QFH0_NASVI|nr:uncharacterized protein LOC100679909 isoform X2 [Nasonia vitripennis]